MVTDYLTWTHRSSAGSSVNTAQYVDQLISSSTVRHYKTAATEYAYTSNKPPSKCIICTTVLITNKCTKRVLSSIVTHYCMFRPCWVIFRENFFVIITLRLHFIVEWECAVDCVLRELSAVSACSPGPQRVHASKNNAVHSQQHILTQL
jgi:hypothetical protein